VRAGGPNSPDGAAWAAALEICAATRADLAGGALGTGGAAAAGASGSRGWFSRGSGSRPWDSRA
jgi:hypothetical protein